MPQRPETAAEIQYRLQNERECRRLADMLKAELPKSRGFLLLSVDIGPGHQVEHFQSTAYVSSINRTDAAKLMIELIEHWVTNGSVRAADIFGA